MTFFVAPVPAPLTLPEGEVTDRSIYTGTACLALMDTAVTGEVWEDLLYDGVDHDHGAGGLMLNSASVGTHLEHDGDFPVRLFLDGTGAVVGLRVNIDPYAEDLAQVRHLVEQDDLHTHAHSHGEGHEHTHAHANHGHEHPHDDAHSDGHGHGETQGHEHGHGEGWSSPVSVRLETDTAVFGDPAALPEADDTGDLLGLRFPQAGGTLTLTVYTDHGLRREVLAVWTP